MAPDRRGETIDLVVTSPPYNFGIAYGRYSDRQDREGYLDWCHEWAAQIRRVLKPARLVFSQHRRRAVESDVAARNRDAIARIVRPAKYDSLDQVDHDRGSTGRDSISHGHFKPISSQRFLNDCHEYIFHFTKTGRVEIDRLALGVPYQDKSNIARWSHTRGSDLRCRGNTWFIPYETIQSRAKERPHPATFPVQLAEWCIKLHGVTRVETMLDPFLGIGNSAVAAKRCGVKRFIGFEIDEEYLAEAKRRLGGSVIPSVAKRSRADSDVRLDVRRDPSTSLGMTRSS